MKQTIGIGTTANDGTGDPLRTAYNKINLNFTELYGSVIYCGDWDLSLDVVPQTGGTGASGAINKGNLFYINVGAVNLTGPDGGKILKGYLAMARIDVPGIDLSDRTKWILLTSIV